MNTELRCKVKTTAHEIAYRKEHCQDDLTMIDDDDMQCTACGDQLIAKKGRCFINRVVGTLQCQICYERCADKQPWKSTNRSHFCMMCGKSSEQMKKCAKKDCTYSSCQVCILRNKSDASVETNKRRWNCFICNIEQLYPRRAVAATVMASFAEKSRERALKNSVTKNNDNEMNNINMKKNAHRYMRGKKIISSDSELSSDESEVNIFQKKLATQKSTKSSISLNTQSKTKRCNIDSTMGDDDNDDDLIYGGQSDNKNSKQLSVTNSELSKNKHDAMNVNTQQLRIQKLKQLKKNNPKKMCENNNDNTNKCQEITRASSTSSSDKEFSRHKIIHSYVSLHRISDIEGDYTVSPTQSLATSSQSSSTSTLSKQDAFILKNNVHKFFREMKQSVKKLENQIELIERNYHYKEKLKIKDATKMMVECTNMIRDWKEHVNNSEDKVVNRYNTWCKKAKVKNIFINKSNIANNIDTPNRYKEKINQSVLISSSGSESDATVIICPTTNKPSTKSIISNDSTQAVNKVNNQKLNELPENIIEKNVNSNTILNSNDESDVELRNISSVHAQINGEIDKDVVKDLSPIPNVDESINNSRNSPIIPTERSSTPVSKLDFNVNYDYSPESSIDMFQDDNEYDNNEEDPLLPMTIEDQIEKSTEKTSSPKSKSINEDNNENEKKTSKKSTTLDNSSPDSADKMLPASNKKSQLPSATDKKEENEKKTSKKKSSNAEEKSIDNNNDKLIVKNNTPVMDNDSNIDDNEAQARKALLDSSSDSEPEVSLNTSNEGNNLLLDDDELSDNELIVKDDTKEQRRELHKSIKSSSNCLISVKSKRNKFILRNNDYFKNDVRLRCDTTVELSKLGNNILSQHSNALKQSKEYLENKQVKSLMSIDNIEKTKKKKYSSEDGETSVKQSEKSKKKDKDVEETLLDHLNKITENNEENNSENDDDRNSVSKNDLSTENNHESHNISTESFKSAADNLYKNALLESSNSEAEDEATQDNEKNKAESDNDSEKSDVENADKLIDGESESKDNANKTHKRRKSNDSDSTKDDGENDKGRWKRSKMLTMTFSSTDSENEERKIKKKIARNEKSSKNGTESGDIEEDNDATADSSSIKKKRTRRRRLASDDSDVKITDDSNSSDSDDDDDDGKKSETGDHKKEDGKKIGKRRRKSDNSSDSSTPLQVRKSKLKRKRIRAVADDSDSESGNDNNSSQGGTKSGRKNIRKVLKDKQVAEDTKQAGKLEEERLKRMADRQKLYNEMYEARLANEKKVDKLVLDFDEESKEVLLSADEKLVKRLKPHQARGIKFMWDAAFESLERAKTTSGSGCILAHCMGLGKSFQVVTLSHTLLSNNEKTGVDTILIVAPLSTVLNWVNEFKMWLSEVENGDDIEIYEMTKCKTTTERKYQLESWMRTGGILIIGYEMFRNLTNATKKVKKSVRESILKCLVDPGADLVVCDEGHLLKNEDSAISKAMRRIRTLRRIVLTGTPLQNNLIEYHCMVQFVKPNLLGTKKEFLNRFVNPIQNGQFDNSTEYDVKVMKKRAHVLHKMLEGSVQRFDYSVLMPFLPPKQEYVILLRLTDVQVKLYQYYLDKKARQQVRAGSTLFADFQALQRIWTHPTVVKAHSEKMIEKRRETEVDSEGSLKDFIDDSDSDSSSKSSTNNDSDVVQLDSSDDQKKSHRRGTRANPVAESIDEPEVENKEEWWSEFVDSDHFDDMRVSAKLLILFDIIKECEAMGDKVLVFSQSLYSLTLIENFLSMIDDETQKGNEVESLDNHTGSWSLGLDYFRFDGQTSADNRSHWVKSFNRPSNTRARLFLISTRAGGLGINLTAANRVVIFDASWNPSHDVQSIFRIYRFGQKKPCYVYRLLAAGTMEEKIYNRQVTKLSLSCRVVDEQQIERHFSNNDLAELYKFEPPKTEPSQLALPKDRLIAEIFLRHKELVETYHEHDSLLENIAEEELDDEERKQAWLEYEQEKSGKRPILPMQIYPTLYQQQTMMIHQSNNQMMNNFNMNEINVQAEFANLLQFIRQDYPHLTEAAQKDMAFRALSNMYNYVENQASNNINNSNMNNPNMNTPNVSNPTATLANALAQQEYSRQHSTVNKYQQQQQQHQHQLQQQQMQYAQKFGNNVGKVAPTVGKTAATSRDDDIIEIPSSSSVANSILPATSSTKSQEE